MVFLLSERWVRPFQFRCKELISYFVPFSMKYAVRLLRKRECQNDVHIDIKGGGQHSVMMVNNSLEASIPFNMLFQKHLRFCQAPKFGFVCTHVHYQLTFFYKTIKYENKSEQLHIDGALHANFTRHLFLTNERNCTTKSRREFGSRFSFTAHRCIAAEWSISRILLFFFFAFFLIETNEM